MIAALRVWVVTGVLLRITRVRDAWDPLAVVFYTTPWPVIASVFALFALHFWQRQRRIVMFRYIAFCVTAVFVWIALSWRTSDGAAAPRELRVVLWNTANSERGFERIARRLRSWDADIIAIAEGGDHLSGLPRWQRAFPEYRAIRLPQQMLCLSRGTLKRVEQGQLAAGSHYGVLQSRIGEREVTILQVDVHAAPRRSRRAPLASLTARAQSLAAGPLLVLGDFNTPHDSQHLSELRTFMRHGFEDAGNGFIETWPTPFPVHNLDQIWSNRGLQTVQCKTEWTWLSDHQPVIADFAFTR